MVLRIDVNMLLLQQSNRFELAGLHSGIQERVSVLVLLLKVVDLLQELAHVVRLLELDGVEHVVGELAQRALALLDVMLAVALLLLVGGQLWLLGGDAAERRLASARASAVVLLAEGARAMEGLDRRPAS